MRCAYREALFTTRDFAIFRPDLEQALKERHKARIASSVSLFAAILDQGDSIAMAPAGLEFGDGRMSQVKSGLGQIIAQTQKPVNLAPLNVTYDRMTTGRGTVFVSFGPPLTGVESWEPERIAVEIQRAVNSLVTVTTGQLVARELQRAVSDGPTEVAEPTLQTRVRSEANRLAEAGCLVDPTLLDAKSFGPRWARFLVHCSRKNLLERTSENLRFQVDTDVDDSAVDTQLRAPWRTHAAELEAVVRARGVSLDTPS
jgi:hypothetical protein